MSVSKEYTAAIHEAGHATMSVIVGRSLDFVDIISQGKTLGSCYNSEEVVYNEDDDEEANGIRILNEVLILLAGTVAESVILGIHPLKTRGSNDYEKADMIFEAPKDGLAKERRDNATKIAFDIINNPLVQQQIKAVANALIEQKTLTGEQVKQIMKQVEDAA